MMFWGLAPEAVDDRLPRSVDGTHHLAHLRRGEQDALVVVVHIADVRLFIQGLARLFGLHRFQAIRISNIPDFRCYSFHMAPFKLLSFTVL